MQSNSNLSAALNVAVYCWGGLMFCGSSGATPPSSQWQLDGRCFTTEWDLLYSLLCAVSLCEEQDEKLWALWAAIIQILIRTTNKDN